MAPHIQSVETLTTRFDPVEAEVTVTAVVEEPGPDLELRGRLVGPSCVYTETIEIAYPLKPVPAEGDLLRARVVIPEANFWEPRTPFLYRGVIELHQNGQELNRASVTHGLRHLILKAQGLRLNGQPLKLRGVWLNEVTDESAERLWQSGGNAVLTNTKPHDDHAWAFGDRRG